MFQLRAHTMVRSARLKPHRHRARLLLEAFEERLCPDAMTINFTDSGSWSQAGNHDSHIKNYIAGRNSGTEFRDFLVFNLARVDRPIIGAELRLYNPQTGFSSPNPSETY